MPSAEHFPIYFPPDARRAFAGEGHVRRIAKVAHLTSTARVLELFGSQAGVHLARETGCRVVLAESVGPALDSLKERVKSSGLGERAEVRQVDFAALSFAEGEFDCILSLGRVAAPLAVTAAGLRKHLVPKGRLVMTYPVKVGRFPAKAATDFWERKLGEPLRLPREVLQVLEQGGYEPEGVETLGDADLNEIYRDLEPALERAADPAMAKLMREEIALHRSQGGKAGVSYALIFARRKEPGEKPPQSRDSG
jgi:cyclopropane fatty-acyl-phospholipid synthase-like methyltransferase